MYDVSPLKENPGVAQLYGMVTNIDDNIGRLRARLAELNLDENTLLIFMSDCLLVLLQVVLLAMLVMK